MNQLVASTRKSFKMGMAAMQKQRGAEAMQHFQQVLAANPNHAEALYQVGFLLHSAANYSAATEYYQRAMQADPSHVDTYLMLGRLLETQNQAKLALEVVQRATQIAPNEPRTHACFASLLMRFNYVHAVPDYLEPLLPQFPKDMELRGFYCFALKVNGNYEKADYCYRLLLQNYQVPPAFRIMYECYLPRLNRSVEEIDALRAEFKLSMERFIAEKKRVDISMLTNLPVFPLAFHHRDNKELVQLYAKMLRIVAPELNYVAPHCKAAAVTTGEKIRIGFVSRHMHQHSVGSCYRGAMLYLAAQPDMEVVFCNLANVLDDKMQQIIDSGMKIISLPKNLQSAQEAIAAQKFDMLIYPDIGMDTMTHYMAMARLAKYQVCLQGHPETTGIDTVDYLVSSRSYEPVNAQENYTEHLLCNEGVDTVFARPKAPERWLSREELGLPTDKKLYVCPMAIQKFHPDFDDVLANILAADSNAILVLFNDFQQQSASDMLRTRILSKCDASRVIFLEWQPMDSLLSILKESDAVLDTIYFGAGTTAQYAFGFGVPIVTMPGNYARGRVTHAYYSIMGIEHPPEARDTNEYVEMAVKLANDKAYYNRLKTQILAKNGALWDGEPYGPKLVQLVKDIMTQNLEGYRR